MNAIRKVPIEEAPAGIWLNVAAAKAAGWKQRYMDGTPMANEPHWLYPPEDAFGCINDDPCKVPDFSGNLEDAWQLARKAARRGVFRVLQWHTGVTEAMVNSLDEAYFGMSDDSPALAITRAFCKAYGVTEIEIQDV